MALYSQEETVLIFKRCAAAPPSDIKFKKFERLGVLMSKDEPAANEEGVQANSCSVCRKVLPSAHLLDLHISENHDNYFEVKKEKQPMYACYLKGCRVMSSTTNERKDHCITQHKFPANFRFDSTFASTPKPSPPKVPDEVVDKENETAKMDTSETIKPKIEPANTKQLGATPKTGFHFGWHTKKGFASGGSKKKGNKKATNGHSGTPMETMNEDLKAALPGSDEDLPEMLKGFPDMDASRPSWLDEKL